MKKFIIASIVIIILLAVFQYLNYNVGWYIDFKPEAEVTAFVTTKNKEIFVNKNGAYEKLTIKGVDLDASILGHKFTDFAIDEETYLRYLTEIKNMGANTIRIYTIMDDVFYNAFYKFNENNENPLYLLQGLRVTDYANNSSFDALDKQFRGEMQSDAYDAVDIIHGNKNLWENKVKGNGTYRKDISEWVLGYILGFDWNAQTIAYTNNMKGNKNFYTGEYFYTSENCTAFEAMLAEIMDNTFRYESKKYKEQRLISFICDPSIDPFEYDPKIAIQIDKFVCLDFEHIKNSDMVKSGYFASYRLYDFCPRFTEYLSENELKKLGDIVSTINTEAPYSGYLELISKYHTMPIVIAGYGFSSARGSTQTINDGTQPKGGLTEKEQGEALASIYSEIIKLGISGAVVTSWQDVHSHRSSNTMYAVDITKSSEWIDYQTSDQFYGLMAFDPGKKESVSYVDGDISEWEKTDIVAADDDIKLSAKYDEKFVYLMIEKIDLKESDIIYIPIDVTPKTGSNYCEEYDMKFQRNADFVLSIDGKENSRLLVHERYDVLRQGYLYLIEKTDPFVNIPDKNTSKFNKVYIMAVSKKIDEKIGMIDDVQSSSDEMVGLYETGLLRYGNANPNSENFNSLADYIIKDNYIEIRLPWQLLNFSSASRMTVHDDYYENYGVENLKINKIYFGAAVKNKYMPRVEMYPFKLKKWKNNPKYHERLKQSYFIMQQMWLNEQK